MEKNYKNPPGNFFNVEDTCEGRTIFKQNNIEWGEWEGEREGRKGELNKEQEHRKLLQVQNILSKVNVVLFENCSPFTSIFTIEMEGGSVEQK